jgi:signal transduction histidine kinase/FixJ family two-component response regulator
MKKLLQALRSATGAFEPEIEREYRRIYQEPRFVYMQASFVLGVVGFGAFLLMDVLNGTTAAMPGIYETRAAIVLMFAVALATTYLRRQFILRHYTIVVNVYSALGMLGAALLPMAIHGLQTSADIYWSVNSSLTTAAIVIYGFNRLTSRNTALIVVLGCVVGMSTVLLLPVFDWYSFGRLAIHIAVVNLVAFSLRATIERRERQLFLLARENLSKNVYAKELEAARAEAEEGNAIKMRFLSNMSHEFRTPMTGMLQALELVSRAAGSETRTLIDRARGSGQALVKTLDSILEYTAWTRSAVVPHAAPVSLSECVRQLLDSVAQEAADRGLELVLRLDLASSEDVVLIDKRMFEAMLSRLLDNAVRFTSTGSIRVNLELAAREADPYPAAEVRIAIADTGIGIPDDLREAVFAPFYQVDSASTRAVGGTGLGLAIVRRLCDAMGCALALESKLGAGTTVHVRLPAEICKEQPCRSAVTSSAAPSSAALTRLAGRVLLVEDNEFNAALVAELLTLLGLMVTRASDGEQAHRLACEECFEVVLMDCQMPKVDGYESTRRIRSSEQTSGMPRLPIVALTANALSGDRQKCLDAGMDDYLAKPYTAAQVHAKLARWLPERIETSGARSRTETSRTPDDVDTMTP